MRAGAAAHGAQSSGHREEGYLDIACLIYEGVT